MKLNQSVQKAAAILRAAAAARPDGETASWLAMLAGLSHATSLRLRHTLENEGLLMRRAEDRRYVIGLDLLRLGTAAEHAELLPVVSGKPLKRVAEETRETITLSVLRGSPSGCASFTRGP
jgi:DNA-binding IclR family transcriptional regulator